MLGSGPVFALGALSLPSESRSFESNIEAFGGDSAVYKVPWQLDDRNYDGVILIRGRQLDGDHVVLFQREDVSEELRLTPGASDARTPDGEWWTSSMLIPAPGCYAIQIDGLDFADTIIFEIKE